MTVTPPLAVRFILSAAVGIFAAFGVGALAAPDQPRSNVGVARTSFPATPTGSAPASGVPGSVEPGSTAPAGSSDSPPGIIPTIAGPVASFQLTGDGGDPVTFGITPVLAPPTPVKPLPPENTIQLATYVTWLTTGGDQSVVRPPWWNGEVPRVAAITQFDGGPFQNANCTLAAGSMLARLTYGVVTTGSQMRTLQDDQDGGTSLYDLNTALGRGWGVRFSTGALTPLQFRALIYGGAGAVLAGFYSEIPLDLRLQKNFTGGHAIYIDGFRPPGPDGPAAYFVIDPIGRPWEGYDGSWWPAEFVERFATSLGGGFMDAAWGFAGGVVPTKHPILPAAAYPVATPQPTGGTGSPQPSSLADPMPTGDVGAPRDDDPGTTSPPEGGVPPAGSVTTGGGEISTDPGYCTQTPRPPLCPPGLPGTVTAGTSAGGGATGGGSTPTGTGPPSGGGQPAPGGAGSAKPPWIRPHLLWATLIATGTYQLVYAVTPGAALDIWFWATASSSGSIHRVSAELATLKGQAVTVATVTVNPAVNYSFVASGSVRDIRGLSELGSILVGR